VTPGIADIAEDIERHLLCRAWPRALGHARGPDDWADL
jgi:hypothetical protein